LPETLPVTVVIRDHFSDQACDHVISTWTGADKMNRLSVFVFLCLFSVFSGSAFAYSLSDTDNEIVKLGREQLEIPDEIDLEFEELERFTYALHHHRVILSEITARLLLEQEDRASLIKEMVERNEAVFSRYQIDAQRVGVLELVLFKIPEMTDYIKLIARSIDPDIIKRSRMPKTEKDLLFLLEGKVSYSVSEAIDSMKSELKQANISAS
jgi:hypothetical protein